MSLSHLPHAVRRLVAAVRAGAAARMVPPVVSPGPQRTLARDRRAHEDRARYLENLLRGERAAPLISVVQRLDAWCARAAHTYGHVVADGVLDLTNDRLLGRMITETVVACETAPTTAAAHAFAREQVPLWQSFLDDFLERLSTDLGTCWPSAPAYRGPVVAVHCEGDETHNGRRRVLRVDLAGGGTVAYKPRPADGEALFLGELPPEDMVRPPADDPTGTAGAPAAPSVFAFLNGLPPVTGPVRLPELPSWRGTRSDRAAYSWQQWVTPFPARHVVATNGEFALTGTRLEPAQAATHWRRTGALTAACLAFGIADLHHGNLLIGTGSGPDDPMPYPVDLEVYFAGVRRLYDTGLLPPASSDGHTAGLVTAAHWAADGGPPYCLRPDAAGTLRLARADRPYTRTHAPSVVTDTSGRVGFAAYLPAFARGMFDLWTLLCRHRDQVRDHLAERGRGHVVRVVPRNTSTYCRALPDRQSARRTASPQPDEPPLAPAERVQLARGDVPYFFRDLPDGPLLHLDPATGTSRKVPPGDAPADLGHWPPSEAVRGCERLDLASLGLALRDLVTHVRAHGTSAAWTDPALGVRITPEAHDAGSVAFDWPRTGRRIRYRWDETTVRLGIERLAPASPPPAVRDGIRSRLLHLDRIDASIRRPWADGGFRDQSLRRRLDRLVGAAVPWLDDVVSRYGWPDTAMVGPEAAAAACRIVQHAPTAEDFQERCLALLTAAAEEGRVAKAQVAGVSDAVRLARGLPQRYGTKFHVVQGELVPCPIECEDDVDRRRADMGLEPLAAYAARLRQRFPSAGTSHPAAHGTEEP